MMGEEVTKGWRFTIKADILKVIPDRYVTAADILDLLPRTYKNHIPRIQSLGAYLHQMAYDGEIEQANVYWKTGTRKREHVYRKRREAAE